MDFIQVKGNTYAIDGPQLIGLYKIDDTRCLLFDPASAKLREGIEEILRRENLTVAGVVCTHMHYDHHENTRYFRDTYGAQTCLPQIEADIVRCEQSLKNHLFNFTMGWVRNYPRLQNLICPVDRVIGLDEDSIEFCGVRLGIVHTPGHSPDHICIVTPDNVCFAGDTLMTEDILKDAMVPFVFDMTDDLASKEKMKALTCDAYIFCHKGIVYGPVARLAQDNIDRIRQQLAVIANLVTGPMTYSEFYETVITALSLPVGHPLRAQHLERYLRPYIEYLVDVGRFDLMDRNGAPAVCPGEKPL